MAPKDNREDPVFAKIVHGYFPEQALKSMSRKRLEQCVVDLVIYSSVQKTSDRKGFPDLYERLCANKNERPQWWPSDHALSQVLTPDGTHLMEVLRFLAYKCCEYFKKPSAELSGQEKQFSSKSKGKYHAVSRLTYEIADVTRPSRSVRKNVGTQYIPPLPNKRNSSAIEPPEAKQPSLTQDEFLGFYMLRRTSNATVSDSTRLYIKAHHSVKFISCSAIPFSSDLGMELMKRDGHICPDNTKIICLQKRERYTNTIPAPSSNISKYPISYKKTNTANTDRKYHFPKRQIHQHPGDLNYILKQIFCKPMRVQLHRLDLSRIKRKTCTIRKFTGKVHKKPVDKKSINTKPLHELKKDIFVILERL